MKLEKVLAMISFDKWVLPDGEAHLQAWMQSVNRRVDGRLTYQYGKYEEALKHCKNFGTAIDVGAHVGLWSYYMARDFKAVKSFEPMPEHQACWKENCKDRGNAELFAYALGADTGSVSLSSGANSSGDTSVSGVGDIPMRKLDFFRFEDVDLIKIDCEGYEMNVLQGARLTLELHKPVVIVEQKPTHAQKYGFKETEAVDYLRSLGAKLKATISGDYILAW